MPGSCRSTRPPPRTTPPGSGSRRTRRASALVFEWDGEAGERGLETELQVGLGYEWEGKLAR